MEYAEEYLGLAGRAFGEEFVLRKQMDGVQQVRSRAPTSFLGRPCASWLRV